MCRFGQNKTPKPIPCGNAAINATVQLGSNSILIVPDSKRLSRDKNVFDIQQGVGIVLMVKLKK